MLSDTLLPDLEEDDDVAWHDAIEWPDEGSALQSTPSAVREAASRPAPAVDSPHLEHGHAAPGTEALRNSDQPTQPAPHDDDVGLLSARTADGAGDGSVAAVDPHQAVRAPRGSRTEAVRCSFAHDATHFMCSLCRFSSRHFSDLRRHFAARHREVTFVAHFHANCACSTVFPSRAAATKHATQCSSDKTNPISAANAVTLVQEPTLRCAPASAANLSATANTIAAPTDGSGCPPRTAKREDDANDQRHTTERGKRRRLTPPRELQNDDALMIPADEDSSTAPASEPLSPTTHPGAPPTATSSSPPPGTCNQHQLESPPWTLHFDGAFKKSRKSARAGAGAILTNPTNQAMWTCALPLPGQTSTNNTAEYEGLLAGLRAAVSHGVRQLHVKGDSKLVINQVTGTYSATQPRLRALRDDARTLLEGLENYKLSYVDRLRNQTADRLANLGLAGKTPTVTCHVHANCLLPAPTPQQFTDGESRASDTADTVERTDVPMLGDDESVNDRLDVERIVHAEERERLDGDNALHAAPIGHGSAPAKLRPLRLKQLSEDEWEAARAAVKTTAEDLATLIRDAPDWETGEHYLTAVPYRLRAVLAPYSTRPKAPQVRRDQPQPATNQSAVERSFEERLDDANNSSARLQDSTASPGQKRRARRRIKRIQKARARTQLRRRFQQRERDCVEAILRPLREPGSTADASGDDSSRCPISAQELYEFFSGTAAPRTNFDYYAEVGAHFRNIIENYPTPTEAEDVLTRAIATDEIEDILQHVSPQSSPGLDGVGYATYRTFGHELLPLLHAVFSFCWQHKKVPPLWKVGAVRLIHKRGDRGRPENWRPICLQPAIYKLYSGLLTRRFVRWMENNNLLPASQKGFRMMNGCHEHNFVATSLLDHAKRMNKKLYVVWYDLTNAFGSIPQELLWRVLAGMKVPSNFLQLLQDIYHDSYYIITNPADRPATEPIRQETGVYQGCPMSPYLFLAAIAPLLKALEEVRDAGFPLAPDQMMNCTAYADDLKIFSSSADGIRSLHEVVRKFLAWSTLRANPAKCAFLQPTPAPTGEQAVGRQQPAVTLRLQDDVIPAVSTTGGYRYLGVGDGMAHSRHQVQLDEKLIATRKEIDVLMRCGLAPAQIFKAVKTYVLPQLDYALRHVRPSVAQLQSFDGAFVRRVKHLLRLPRPASTEFIFAPTSQGGLGFLPLRELHAAIQISHAFQMLHSPDANIRAVARCQVMQIIQKRYHLDTDYWKTREDEAIMMFLNDTLKSSSYARRRRTTTDIGSLWTDVQENLRKFGLRFDTVPAAINEDQVLQLKVPHFGDWLTTTTVLRRVKLHMKLGHFGKWKAHTTQGRTARVHGGQGSSFLSTSARISDVDYRFAIRSRLDQVETRAVLKRMKVRSNERCRHPDCSDRETLPHILNHCVGTKDATRGRHDLVLGQIAAVLRKRLNHQHAADHQEILINAAVPNLVGGQLKPDIQLLNHATKTATIVDLAVAHEEQTRDGRDCSSLTSAKTKKIKKYSRLFQHYRSIGWKARVGALVYGALGSVAPSNFDTYTKLLGTTKREATRLNKRLSCEVIKGSRRIWHLHAGQHRQRSQLPRSNATSQ